MTALNPTCDVLANLSGGIDSAYGIYLLLKEGRTVLIHHCHLGGNRRVRWETAATEACLAWYWEQGLNRFDYIESSVILPPTRTKTRMRDPDLMMVLSGQILRDRQHIKELAYFNNSQDTSTRYPRTARARVGTLNRWAHRRIVVSRPVQHLSKPDIVRMMPSELLEVCSWCRFPNEFGEPCHRCFTCRKVDPGFRSREGE